MCAKRYYCIIAFCMTFLVIHSCKSETNQVQYACGVGYTQISPNSLDSTWDDNKLIFIRENIWLKNKLNVFFFDGDIATKEKTIEVAREWCKHGNLKINRVIYIEQSDIRVAFHQGNGYSSIIGKKAMAFKNLPTMWLSNLDTKDDAEFKRVVLHEFGHAFGLGHELKNRHANLDWDTSRVYAYFETIYKWKREVTYQQIFAPIEEGIYTKYDPASIMVYAVPDSLFKNRRGISLPGGLSEIDKANFKSLY